MPTSTALSFNADVTSTQLPNLQWFTGHLYLCAELNSPTTAWRSSVTSSNDDVTWLCLLTAQRKNSANISFMLLRFMVLFINLESSVEVLKTFVNLIMTWIFILWKIHSNYWYIVLILNAMYSWVKFII